MHYIYINYDCSDMKPLHGDMAKSIPIIDYVSVWDNTK